MTGDGSGEVVLAPKKNRRARFSRAANARTTIEGFGHDLDISFGLTLGQFSLLDLIEATLDITGPADVAISTWSAGFYDVERAERFRSDGRMRSIRFVLDSSDKRGQATGADIESLFGAESIRTTRTHAKFVVVSNDEWNVVIQSSMNLNLNPRSEQFSMTDDAATAAFVLAVVDELWVELPAGATLDRRSPALRGVAAVRDERPMRERVAEAMTLSRAAGLFICYYLQLAMVYI